MSTRNEFLIIDVIHAANHRTYAGGQFINDSSIRCGLCGAFTGDSYPHQMRIELNHLGRRGFAEQLWNSHGLSVFRNDLIRLWKNSKFTGFQLRPVKIAGWYNKPNLTLPTTILDYFWLHSISKVRLIKPSEKGEPCEKCGFVEYAFLKLEITFQRALKLM